MTTALEITNKLIKRVKLLKRFEVTIDMPGDVAFNGRIPYDMKIKDGEVTAIIYAENFDEALNQLKDFLKI